jgi:hypothetical protein
LIVLVIWKMFLFDEELLGGRGVAGWLGHGVNN